MDEFSAHFRAAEIMSVSLRRSFTTDIYSTDTMTIDEQVSALNELNQLEGKAPWYDRLHVQTMELDKKEARLGHWLDIKSGKIVPTKISHNRRELDQAIWAMAEQSESALI